MKGFYNHVKHEGTTLYFLKRQRVFYFPTTEEHDFDPETELVIEEGCDNNFFVILNKKEAQQLVDELQEKVNKLTNPIGYNK